MLFLPAGQQIDLAPDTITVPVVNISMKAFIDIVVEVLLCFCWSCIFALFDYVADILSLAFYLSYFSFFFSIMCCLEIFELLVYIQG